MKLNFTTYINEQLSNSLMSIQDLLDNFAKVFPYSDKDISVISYHIEGQDTNDMICTGIMQSEFTEHKKYKVTAKFHREDTKIPFSVKNIGEVFCECRAFRYNVAYPDVKTKTFYGQVQGHNRIPNKIRNSKQIPSVCKHLYGFLISLYHKNIIKNN